MNSWNEIIPEKLNENVFHLINKEWMLISAGTKDNYNMMTASWGGFGILWHKPIAWCVVRPSRYTYDFMERKDYYTLSFFNEDYRSILSFCGSHSGRTLNKMKEVNLRPFASPNNSVFYEESRMGIECHKLYFQDLDPSHFLDVELYNHYPGKDYHRMYVGEISQIIKK